MIATLIVMFMLGFFSGAMSLFLVTLYYATRHVQRKEGALKDLGALHDALKATSAISERMLKVKEITLRQLDIQSQLEQPQRSSLDGKYKNLLNGEIKTLEEEKIGILNSILADGHDPVLTVANPDGTPDTLKLSEFMARSGFITASTSEPTKGQPKKVGKFVVYSNKDDSDGSGTIH